jgi:imidazolonepropionase-like amidohydrolase
MFRSPTAAMRCPRAVRDVFIATVVALLLSSSLLHAQQRPLVIRNVSVLPMDREEVLRNQTVVIRDGVILSMGAPPPSLPADAQVIDGTGRYLMPGLAEMHAHVGAVTLNRRILELFALNGVTTIRGMLGAPHHLVLRDSLEHGLVLGPRFMTSGPSFSGPAITPDVAAQRVREQHETGYDLLKIHPGVTREAFDAMAATAMELRMPFAGHVPLAVGLDRAIEAGYNTIDHLDGMVEALLPPGAAVTPADGGWFGLNLVPHLDPSRLPDIIASMRAAGMAVVPTQTLMEYMFNDMTGDQIAAREDYRYWTPGQVEQWRVQKNERLANPQTPSAAHRAQYLQTRARMIRALDDAGVPVLLGADAPQVFNVPGFSAHRELHLYVAAGLTPFRALRTGTYNVAQHLGEGGAAGVVRPRARADLILLDANPLDNIENSMRIHGVVLNGRWIGAEERTRRLEALRTDR